MGEGDLIDQSNNLMMSTFSVSSELYTRGLISSKKCANLEVDQRKMMLNYCIEFD